MKINIKNLSKYYDYNLVLDDISINIKNVSSIGIIGKSGCGKSTLLRQLSAIEISNSGSIKINDFVIDENNLTSYHKKIGYVFQNHNLFPHLSIRENIALILEKIYDFSQVDANRKISQLLEEFHLLEIADKIPSKISGGQAQRASIARAISTNPDILYLDEPTAALDPLLTKEVLESIKLLKNKGSEIVFVTHEMDFLKNFADYFIFMDKGKIIEHNYISELYNAKTDKLNKFLNKGE